MDRLGLYDMTGDDNWRDATRRTGLFRAEADFPLMTFCSPQSAAPHQSA